MHVDLALVLAVEDVVCPERLQVQELRVAGESSSLLSISSWCGPPGCQASSAVRQPRPSVT
jgi:hypothetical protein